MASINRTYNMPQELVEQAKKKGILPGKGFSRKNASNPIENKIRHHFLESRDEYYILDNREGVRVFHDEFDKEDWPHIVKAMDATVVRVDEFAATEILANILLDGFEDGEFALTNGEVFDVEKAFTRRFFDISDEFDAKDLYKIYKMQVA